MSPRNKTWLTLAVGIVAASFLFSIRPLGDCRGCRRNAVKVQINAFEGALGQYKEDTHSFPSQEQGLSALRDDPGVKGWNGPYLSQDVPNDPWNRPYLYKYPGEHGDEPDIVSLGADGQPGGEGSAADIVSWKSN